MLLVAHLYVCLCDVSTLLFLRLGCAWLSCALVDTGLSVTLV